jgi:LPXTG-motif cell wall-anchored protein
MVRRLIATGCVFFGAVLLYIGYDKTQSVMGGLSKTFSGGYSTETLAYLIGGCVLFIAGLFMLMRKKKR